MNQENFLPVQEYHEPINEFINKTLNKSIPLQTEKKNHTKRKKNKEVSVEKEKLSDYSIVEPSSGYNLEKKDYPTSNNITFNTLVNTPVNNILERRDPKTTTDLSSFGFTSILNPLNNANQDLSPCSAPQRPNKTMSLFKNEPNTIKEMVIKFLKERKEHRNLLKNKNKQNKEYDFESTQYSEHSVYSPRENDHDSIPQTPEESNEDKESIATEKKETLSSETPVNQTKQTNVSLINDMELSFEEKLDIFSSKNFNEITDEEIEYIHETRKKECVICTDMQSFLDDNVTKRLVNDAMKNETHAALYPQSLGLYNNRKLIEEVLIEKNNLSFNPWYLLDVYTHLGGYCQTMHPEIIKAANTRILNEMKTQGTKSFYYVNENSTDMNKTSATMILKSIEFLEKSNKNSFVAPKSNSSQKSSENSDSSLKRLFNPPKQTTQFPSKKHHEKKRKLLGGDLKDSFYDVK